MHNQLQSKEPAVCVYTKFAEHAPGMNATSQGRCSMHYNLNISAQMALLTKPGFLTTMNVRSRKRRLLRMQAYVHF